MNRDKEIQRVFEIADDSLQGVLGHYLYVTALQLAADNEKVTANLPAERIPMTFSWDRFYRKEDLIEAFKLPEFQIYQARISLTTIVNVFEVALKGFIQQLAEKNHPQRLKNRYLRTCIQWASEQLSQCDIGDPKAIERDIGPPVAIKRLPRTLGIIDNARRLRNLIVHNQGLFDDTYEKDAIKAPGIAIDMHPDFLIHKTKPENPVPIVFDTGYFFRFSKAHIEVLHLLHNFIQKKYFGFQDAYDYSREKKGIEWNKVLWGSAKVKIQAPEV